MMERTFSLGTATLVSLMAANRPAAPRLLDDTLEFGAPDEIGGDEYTPETAAHYALPA
ncbi:Hypothetical protein GbCGDNIH9_2381 [Granulibacter bethesdensis]|uniref:Uncharacterized protein n=2 Tax=Granulibacter bethesdensis TaxID=364410 RepID=A0AAC9P9Z6_9PROT|nr:Hypothetical protein GbCGDNIH9_2381 [Granulibacter bethesdensis]APH63299.1 Hypothetical protein GbCGDNIH8_2381 [Granulibacter bethesdensis]